MKTQLHIVRTSYIPATEKNGSRIRIDGPLGRVYHPFPYESSNPHLECVERHLDGIAGPLHEVEDKGNRNGRTFVFWPTCQGAEMTLARGYRAI